ncbi:ABC transporter substrate-binding protein [Arthrobacter sp. GMC3]|uniref:ABC transporter substrate-binding protein n=1 Tax=Arthrobacter sp. GMC3 TaxID=2058894 RepID=UPI0015E34437|nr:ABC transporter substrate-binding protein [Arthrobacter sp. GMC3]
MRSKRIVATAAALALALGLSACGGSTSTGGSATAGKDGVLSAGTLTLAALADNNSFDRAALEIGHKTQYWMPVFDTLLVLDPQSVPQPGLATKWSYNADNTVLSLTLREGVKFTDGAPFDGKAVAANLDYLKNGGGQNAYMAKSVKTVDVVDATHANLVLSAPDPGLLGYLGVVGGAMASPASLTAADKATNPVGSGPYVLDKAKTVAGSQFVYERNADYWDLKSFPYEKLIIKPMTDVTARINALKSGQVNGAVIDSKSAAEAKSSGLQVETTQVDWTGLFLADREGKVVPALGDVRVRQAINYLFDSPALLKGISLGQGEVTNQVFGKSSQAYVPALDNYYSHDEAKAKKLMADAGYADGFTVTMPDSPGFATVNPILEQTLLKLNIKTEWVKVAPDALGGQILAGKFPMFVFNLGSQSAWQDIQKVALPTSPWNTAKVNSAELNALIEKAQFATGSEQDTAMQAVNTWLVKNAWFAPFYRMSSPYATDAKTKVVLQSQNAAPWIRSYSPAP